MGAATSTGLVDSVVDGDIQQLKTILSEHRVVVDSHSTVATKDSTWNLELEQAVHTVVASEVESGQHLQQLQIALELLLQVSPEAWSSTASSQDSGDNFDGGTDTSATSNSAGWSACHRACATGNLAFVTFVLQQYPLQFNIQIRDVFGLFPIDLVPPELLMSKQEITQNLQQEHGKIKPGSIRSRRCLALQSLRERKTALQNQQIRSLLGDSKSQAANAPNNQDEEAPEVNFYVSFEPRHDHLSIDLACNMGHVHERGALLRVNYRVPRAEPFLDGYFQLIWRELGDARSEEPHYDSRVTRLRDNSARFLSQQSPIQPQHPLELQDSHTGEGQAKDSSGHRSIDGFSVNSVLEGGFPVDVTHLPADSVCHVLFIACDRQMLHRTIAMSTEGLAVQSEDLESDDDFSDSTSEEDDYHEEVADNQGVNEKQPGYTFFVGGEEFSHPNSLFAGQSFPGVEEFESFLRDLRVKKQRRLQEKQEQQEREAQQALDEFSVQNHNKQQEAGQEAEEMAIKVEVSEVFEKLQQDEVRLPDSPAVTSEQDHNNQNDD